MDEYGSLARRFAHQAVQDGRTLLYIRFADHESVLDENCGAEIHTLDPRKGFEFFTGTLHTIIEKAGRDAFYVFDCLSVLQTAWAADLMLGNFFMVTCPYLFELDTVAFFCLLRGRHSYDTVARIRETTQLLIDIFSDGEALYIHPLKVWNRYSPTMFFPHSMKDNTVQPLTDGVTVSRFYQLVSASQQPAQNLDSWERFFIDENAKGDDALVRDSAERLIGQENRMMDLIEKYCTARDMMQIKAHLIGSGKIGGKAAGMIVARTIIRKTLPEIADVIEPHDSWYIGSDVFYTYMVHNKLWKKRMRQRTYDGYFDEAHALAQGLTSGSFPENIRAHFIRLIEYFGQSPIIVRSSSLLEDSFGNAFAGKYESIFCVNAGEPNKRLAAFEDAVRRVYASMMNESALVYRRLRGLDESDEQMAILVQRVSGSLYGNIFMPVIAGVGYSYSAWRWDSRIDPSSGMIRVVAGLGTRAVDRTGGDYPRLVSLGAPGLFPGGSKGSKAQTGQRHFDCIDIAEKKFTTIDVNDAVRVLPPHIVKRTAEHDSDAEAYLRENGRWDDVFTASCPAAAEDTQVTGALQKILSSLQNAYNNPVDIEFTVNWAEDGSFMINLLQCRPLQAVSAGKYKRTAAGVGAAGVSLYDAGPAGIGMKTGQAAARQTILRLDENTMGPQIASRVNAVVIVDPQRYYELPYRKKPDTARVVGRINAHYASCGKTVLLFVPGRIGTSSPELGVSASFADICHFSAVFEMSYKKAGYNPELSFGSHFFQDLVEEGIYYGAVNDESVDIRTPLLSRAEQVQTLDIKQFMSSADEETSAAVTVIETSGLYIETNVQTGSCEIYFI